MTWQNAKSSLRARSAHQVSLTVVEFTLSGYHLDMQRIACRHRYTPLSLLLLGLVAIHNILDAACHVEVGFRDMIVLAIKNLLEATDGVLQRHISAFASGKCLRYYEWL